LVAFVLAVLGAAVWPAANPASASAGYGTMSIAGAFQASYTIAGLCSAHASVLTSVTLRNVADNGTTVSVAGSTVPPTGPVNLDATTIFNVEVQVAEGPGAGGSWLAGYAGGRDLGSGTLVLSPSASAGSVDATLEPYGGLIDKPINLRTSWNCAGGAAPPATTTVTKSTSPKAATGNPVARLMALVPSSYFGCTSNPQLNLGGQSTVFRYKAIAEVDCQVEGVAGVNLAIYTLYPSGSAMNSAFEHVWVDQWARPKSSLGCPQKTFTTAVCYYRTGEATSAAGKFVRFMFVYPADPNPTPSITWTSDRFAVISYLAGANPDDTQQVLQYWQTGAPNPS
jgi:hypothetical protein